MAHFGTLTLIGVTSLALSVGLLGCDQSHQVTDAGVDASTPIPDGGRLDGSISSCSGSESDLLGTPVGFDSAVESTPTAAIVTSVAEGEVLLDVAGSPIRYRFEGLSTEGITAGAEAMIYRDELWESVDIGEIGLRVMRYSGFVGGSIVGTPLTPPGGPSVTLVAHCTFPDPSGGACDQPRRDVVLYALELPDGTRLATQEGATFEGAEIFHGGSAQYPGYGSDMCVLEAGFGSRTSIRLPLGGTEPATCEEVEAAYQGLIADNSSCSADTDCVASFGQCGVGLGGCYEATNRDLNAELEAYGRRYAELGCTSGVCDCAGPPEPFCDAGSCALRF